MMHSATTPSRFPVTRFSRSDSASGKSVRIHHRLPFPISVKLQRIIMKNSTFPTNSSLSLGNEATGRVEHKVGEQDAVIIVDHGSRRQESNLMLNEFVAMFKARTGYQIVEPAHMELAKPSISDSFRLCMQKGAKRVIVSPFFLSPGRHWLQKRIKENRLPHPCRMQPSPKASWGFEVSIRKQLFLLPPEPIQRFHELIGSGSRQGPLAKRIRFLKSALPQTPFTL
ncbi:Sirohydrochlorin [Musa troglodytarum]|uniref:Sirohydrochlorin n=1 Tax=Musa troglodytarum TaxID=320322 RepID=A0A9E7IBL0_9LILI|nr:Sirohydrochlorin [Musa troglodytarum]URE44343.1 Sirohydrochlorin [Musa troglodytarum]